MFDKQDIEKNANQQSTDSIFYENSINSTGAPFNPCNPRSAT